MGHSVLIHALTVETDVQRLALDSGQWDWHIAAMLRCWQEDATGITSFMGDVSTYSDSGGYWWFHLDWPGGAHDAIAKAA